MKTKDKSCDVCFSYGVQTVSIKSDNSDTNTNVCFVCLDEQGKQNTDNRLCEICNQNPPRTLESKYCQECRDWFKRS